MHFLGIDFGTTKTLAARWDERTQSARTIRLGRGSDAIPTTLYCDDKGEFQFGDDADDMRALDAAGWKGRIKRDLGKGASVVLHGKSYKVVHLISRFLGYVRERVEKEVFHGKIDHTVITVPALYGPSERSELKDAAALAGLRSVELVDEPVAAGRAFLHDKAGTELGDQVLVFDWGGGTLDLALVERRDGAFHLNHDWIGGEKNLGGEDIDDAMIEEADRRYAESHGRIDEQEDGQQMHIRRNLKECKELLSRRAQHKFRLPYSRPQEFSWSRVEFEEFTASITDQAIDCLSKQVQKIRAKGVKPQQVLLVGGSSNMPVVKRRIEDELGLKVLFWENSQTAVALGSATNSQGLNKLRLPENIHPSIVEKWNSLGAESSFLGEFKGASGHCPDEVGTYAHFENGSIHWHPCTGAHETHGAIRSVWAETGWEHGNLGYPTSDEVNLTDLDLMILQGLTPSEHEVQTKMGTPIKPEPKTIGRCANFQRGKIVWYSDACINTSSSKTEIWYSTPSSVIMPNDPMQILRSRLLNILTSKVKPN